MIDLADPPELQLPAGTGQKPHQHPPGANAVVEDIAGTLEGANAVDTAVAHKWHQLHRCGLLPPDAPRDLR